jgi:hypothetical protein
VNARLRRLSGTGWPASFPVAQFPNAPLAAALAGILVERLTEGRTHAYAQAVVSVGLGVWAYGELTEGVNWFRRLLGGAGLVYVLVRLGMALES